MVRPVTPGAWIRSKYVRRIHGGARSGATELHDRRLNPVKRHFYGKDRLELKKISRISSHRRKGNFVRSHVRRN